MWLKYHSLSFALKICCRLHITQMPAFFQNSHNTAENSSFSFHDINYGERFEMKKWMIVAVVCVAVWCGIRGEAALCHKKKIWSCSSTRWQYSTVMEIFTFTSFQRCLVSKLTLHISGSTVSITWKSMPLSTVVAWHVQTHAAVHPGVARYLFEGNNTAASSITNIKHVKWLIVLETSSQRPDLKASVWKYLPKRQLLHLCSHTAVLYFSFVHICDIQLCMYIVIYMNIYCIYIKFNCITSIKHTKHNFEYYSLDNQF